MFQGETLTELSRLVCLLLVPTCMHPLFAQASELTEIIIGAVFAERTRFARPGLREPEAGCHRVQGLQARRALAVRRAGGRVRACRSQGFAECAADSQGTIVKLYESLGCASRASHQLPRNETYRRRSSPDLA